MRGKIRVTHEKEAVGYRFSVSLLPSPVPSYLCNSSSKHLFEIFLGCVRILKPSCLLAEMSHQALVVLY